MQAAICLDAGSRTPSHAARRIRRFRCRLPRCSSCRSWHDELMAARVSCRCCRSRTIAHFENAITARAAASVADRRPSQGMSCSEAEVKQAAEAV